MGIVGNAAAVAEAGAAAGAVAAIAGGFAAAPAPGANFFVGGSIIVLVGLMEAGGGDDSAPYAVEGACESLAFAIVGALIGAEDDEFAGAFGFSVDGSNADTVRVGAL